MLRRPFVTFLAVAAVTGGLMIPPASASASAGASATATAAAQGKRTALRVATFNVRTARATQDARSWLTRAPDVAREILSRNPGVVALQELGPGRADGQKGTLHGTARQTDSLLSALARLRGDRYKLVRSTPYVAPGQSNGTQGARILYDASRYALLSSCPEKTGKHAYSPSCSINLPLAPGDGSNLRRQAAYAQFSDRRTGQNFYVVSAHLDSRHSPNNSAEARYNELRGRQAAAIATVMARVNSRALPVVVGGDLNSWRNDRGGDAPHRALVAHGFSDTATARNTVNLRYTTVNHFQPVLTRSARATGVQLDVVMVKGGRGATRFENKMSPVDRDRPSDHNMVISDIVL